MQINLQNNMNPTITPNMNTVPQYPGATAPFLNVGQSRTDASGGVLTKVSDIPSNLPSNTPPTVPLNIATGNVQPIKLPTTPISGGATSLSAQSNGYLAQPVVTNLNQLGGAAQTAGQNLEVAQTDYQTQVKDLLNQLTTRPGQLESQYNIQGLSADALKAKANYDSVELGYRRQKEALMANGALSAEQKQANIAEIDRKEASQKADIAIDYNLKSGLLSNAKELMNKQIELELEPMKLKVDYYKTLKDDYKDVFNTAQNRQIDYLAKKEERAYQAAKDDKDFFNQIKLQAYKDGKLSLSDFNKANSFDSLSKLTGVTKDSAETEIKAKDKINEIDSVLAGKGVAGAVGATVLSRNPVARALTFGAGGAGARKNFVATTESLLNQLTLDSLVNAKKNGATFGALSEGELSLLSDSATKINQTKVLDKNKKTVGYAIAEDEFNNAMEKIKNYAILDYERKTGKKYIPPAPVAPTYNGIQLPTDTGSNYIGITLPN